MNCAPDPAVLQMPATDENFAATTAPLWAWYDALRPHLWRQGRQLPDNGPAQRQLLNDGEIDMMVSFNPAEAAVSIQSGTLPASARTFVFAKGTIGNTSFVAIPFNAASKEGAMVVADFLLEPVTQAYAQDIEHLGNFTVLDLSRLSAGDRQRFLDLPKSRSAADQRRTRHRVAGAASVVDDAHRGRVGAPVHEVMTASRTARRPIWLAVIPAITVGVLLLPIGAGLLGTLLPAFGYLPAIGGRALDLAPWRHARRVSGLRHRAL